jgi:hypothetical protein
MGNAAIRRKRPGSESSGAHTEMPSHGLPEGLAGRPAPKGSMSNALLQISDNDARQREEGAVTLQRLMAKKPYDTRLAATTRSIIAKTSFGPLLEAAEREQDKPVKIGLLKALWTTSNAGEFTKPTDLLERMEKMIFTESDRDAIFEAARVIYYCTPGDRESAERYFSGLGARADKELGPEHAISKAIWGAYGDFRSRDMI